MLRDLGFFSRVSVSLLMLAVLGGYAVSGYYLKQHYENRDEQPGLTLTDIKGAYAGATVEAPLLSSLERGHPDDLPESDRQALIDWLRSDTIERDYENFDLDPMPADVIFDQCLSCHSREAEGPDAYPAIPLEYWDEIAPLTISKEILPKDPKVVIASIHAHLPTMGLVLLVVVGFASVSRVPQWLVGITASVAALGLLGDFGSQWFARDFPELVYLIVGGGAVYSAGVTLLGLAVMLDCWLPRGRKQQAAVQEPSKPMNRPV